MPWPRAAPSPKRWSRPSSPSPSGCASIGSAPRGWSSAPSPKPDPRSTVRGMSSERPVHDYGADIYTEAEGSDDGLANLGPLRPLAGVWTSVSGADVHPIGPGSDISGTVVGEDEHQPYLERYELQPIDPQT